MFKALRNALLAAAYIVVVASVLYFGEQFTGPNDSVLMPIAMLSLFTLSAAVMGYLFVWQPAELYFSRDKKAAIQLFFQTLGFFAVITALLVGTVFVVF